jgi:hypothetical protein
MHESSDPEQHNYKHNNYDTPFHYESQLALVGVGSRWFGVGVGQRGVGHQRPSGSKP